jgi:hypothetical protein
MDENQADIAAGIGLNENNWVNFENNVFVNNNIDPLQNEWRSVLDDQGLFSNNNVWVERLVVQRISGHEADKAAGFQR